MKIAPIALSILLASSALAFGQIYGQKVSRLPPATTPLSGDELVYVIQNGTSRQASVSDVIGSGGNITSLTARPFFWVVGIDGTPQGGFGYTWRSSQFAVLQGSRTGAGGSMICRSNTATYITDDVPCNIVASNNGQVKIWNGYGNIANFKSRGGSQLDIPLTITSGNPSAPADISYNGNAPTLGGDAALTTGTLTQQYALNANPDFWLDNVNAGGVTTVTSGTVADGWRTTDSVSGKVSFQRISLPGLGQAFTSISFAEKMLVVAGAYASDPTDEFNLYQNISGGEASTLQWGSPVAQAINDTFCMLGSNLTVPFTLAIAYQNNGASGSPDRSYVTSATLTTNGGWYCFVNYVPGDTTGSWRSSSYPNFVGVKRLYDIGSGTNFQTATPNAWADGYYTTLAGASSLVGQPAGSYLLITRARMRPGPVYMPYIPLSYAGELSRAQTHFFSTFPPNTKPATNIGTNTGEIQFPAQVAGTGNNIVTVSLPNVAKENYGNYTSTFFNPSAANANCRDETASASGGTVTVLQWSPGRITLRCAGAAGTAVGNILGIHMTLDAM